MNIDLEEGEVKSDEEKSNNRILGIDNSDRINDGLEDEEEAPKTSKTVTYGRRLKNNKKRGGNKRHYEREDSSTLIVGDDKNDEEEVTTPNYDDIYNIDLDDIEVLEDKHPKAAENNDDEDEENNPFDELDPQMIELKIKALKSLFAKNSSSTSTSSNKRLVKMKSPKTKRNVSNRGENDTNDRDFYLELGRRNLEKVNMCMLGDYDERLMRGGDNYEMQDMELDLSNRQSQQQPICSGISPPQPQPSLFAQLNLTGGFESMFPSTPNIPTHSSNYSTTLLQTQLLQDQLLYNYYQKAGLTSLLPSWQSTNNQNNTNLSSLLLPAIFSALPLLIDPNSVATSTSAITPPNNTIDSTMPPQRATNMMMRNQRPQQQQLNDFRNYGNKKKKNKRLNQNLNLSNRRQMELAIRNKSRAKLMKIRESVNEMMTTTTTNTGDGVINESGLDVDERFIDLTSDRLDVDYRDLASGAVNKSRKRSMSEEKVVNEQPLRKSRSREEQPKGQQPSSIQKAKSVERSQSVDDKQKQLEKQQHNEKQRREESPKSSKKEASKEYRRSVSKEKSDEEKEREKAEREILELRRKLIENMNQRRLLKKQQEEQEIKQPPPQPQQNEKKTISNDKQASSEAAAKKAESAKPTTTAAANVSTMNEDMSYFKKKLLEHEQVLSKSTSQSQSSSNINNMNHTGNKRIDRILIRINPNDDDDDEDSDDESLSTDDDDEEILMARKKAVLSSKLSTTKTLLQQNIGQFLEQAKRMALMADAQKQNTRLVVGGGNNKPANNQVVKPPATVNNEPTKQINSPTTLLNSTDITSEKDKESLIKALRDRINLKSKLIAELAKRSSDLQEFTSRKEKDIDLTKKKITMLREQLQAAEKILAVNERSLSSFKAEKSKIDTKLVSMQYQKKIQQAQLQKVLSISTTTPTSIASNPTTLVAAKTMATTTLSKQTPPPNTSITKSTVEKTSNLTSDPLPKVTSPNNQQKTTITPPKPQQEASNAASVTLGGVKESTKSTTTQLVIQLESSPEERKEPQKQHGEKKTVSENKPNQENKQAQVSPPPPLPKEPSPKPPLPPTQQPQQESNIPKPPPTNKPKPAPLNLMAPVSTTLGSEVAATAAAVGSQSRITITSRSQSSNSSGSSSNTTRPNLFTSKQTDSKLEQIGMQQQNNAVVVEPSRRLNENVVVNAKVVNVSNRKVAPPNKHQQINNNKSNNQQQKPTNQQAEDEAAKDSKKAELKHRQRLNECLIEITRDYPHIHANSFDVWSNECIIDSSSTNSCNPSFESNLPIGIESKISSLSINQVLTSSNFTKLVECEEGSSDDTYSPMIYTIENPAEYESPLRCLRGYRFSSNFVAFNQFEEAYSKFYCNSIDFRRPFCPFDLHGSCKDSSCLYQHLNVITMDNFQRTEHFLSYCPQVLGFSSERPTQREAIKKLKAYAKTFMENNLKQMSIKDYFKYLYDHIVENLKIDPPNSTILSRLPILCLNNNKSIGAYDHLEVDIESKSSVPQFAMMPSTTRGVADIEAAATNSFTAGLEQLHTMFDLVLSPANIKRSLEARFYSFLVTRDLDVDWLKRNEQFVESLRSDADVKLPKSFIHDERYFTTKSDLITAWIFHARQELHNTSSSSSESGLERVLNVLSHALESNPRSELIWLLYLKCYVCKRNSLSDYHEICLLCMDNLLTYDLVWLILNTCPVTYIDLPIERYERFLLSCTHQELVVFEQQQENREQNLNETIVLDDDEDVDANNKQINRVSYYLFELIVFTVYIKLNSPDTTPTEKTVAVQKQTSNKADEANKSGIESSKAFLTKCLNRTELVNKLEPSDLALLWLCAIHLEAFNHLPSWLMSSELLMSKLSKSLCQASFWSTNILDKRRQFNQRLFVSLNYAYENNTNNMMLANDNGERLMRQYDVFLMPWTASASVLQPAAPKYASSLDKLQNMFYQALRALNIRMPANADSPFALKHRIRMLSLPLYVNLIGLEVANKRYDTAIQICERLLKSADARKIKELWLTIIYIHRCKSQSSQQVTAESTKSNSSDSSLVEETVKTCLNMFPEDAQVTYVAAQFFSSIKKHSTSIELIEEYILRLYFGKSRVLNSSPNMLFRHLLGLVVNPNRDRNILSNADLCKSELDKLDFIYHSRLDQFELKSNILNICLCYCYYMELKGSDEFDFDQVCRTYERLIRNLHIVNQRVVLWIRYFKYLWSNETAMREKEGKKHLLSSEMKTKIKECLEDVKNSSQRTKLNLITPFGYLPPINSVESHSVLKRKNDIVANSSFLSTSMKRAKTSPFYYSNRDETTTSATEHDVADMTSSSYDYYHNCVADALVRLASQSGSAPSERFALVRLLVELMPTNIDLVKQFVWLSVKVNGLHRTVQLLYDHFCVNSIGVEHLWILCIKLCLDLNDMQQAVLMYHKAVLICSKQFRSTFELKRLAAYLFPSATAKESCIV